jgi:hypothetical protein
MEFGKEFRPFGIGLGGFMEGQGVVNRLNLMLMTPEEKFLISLNAALDKIGDYRPLDRNTRDAIISFADKMPNMSYKNATAYVLGCLASANYKVDRDGNNVLNKSVLKNISSLLPNFKDAENITTSDVIRYARFAIQNDFPSLFDESSKESQSSNEF